MAKDSEYWKISNAIINEERHRKLKAGRFFGVVTKKVGGTWQTHSVSEIQKEKERLACVSL